MNSIPTASWTSGLVCPILSGILPKLKPPNETGLWMTRRTPSSLRDVAGRREYLLTFTGWSLWCENDLPLLAEKSLLYVMQVERPPHVPMRHSPILYSHTHLIGARRVQQIAWFATPDRNFHQDEEAQDRDPSMQERTPLQRTLQRTSTLGSEEGIGWELLGGIYRNDVLTWAVDDRPGIKDPSSNGLSSVLFSFDLCESQACLGRRTATYAPRFGSPHSGTSPTPSPRAIFISYSHFASSSQTIQANKSTIVTDVGRKARILTI